MQKTFLLIAILLKIVNVAYEADTSETRSLSRRKRNVIFPEGSSFQLVYCLTMPTYGMGQIFTIGLTAALAWELPHEPIHFKDKKGQNSTDKRIDRPSFVSFTPSGKIPLSTVYKSPFTEYKSQWPMTLHSTKTFLRRPAQQGAQSSPNQDNWDNFLPAYRNKYAYHKHGDVHRRTRRALFEKIETFFQAQNKDGRVCLLKAICEVNQTHRMPRGTFIEEILRAIFTWRSNEDDENGYTKAVISEGNCTEKYPTCTQSVWNNFL